jgi:hypothetical protein
MMSSIGRSRIHFIGERPRHSLALFGLIAAVCFSQISFPISLGAGSGASTRG